MEGLGRREYNPSGAPRQLPLTREPFGWAVLKDEGFHDGCVGWLRSAGASPRPTGNGIPSSCCHTGKAVGDYWQKFASTRAFLTYMMTHPGKKLHFMGNEIGQFREWDYKGQIEWFLLDYESHSKFKDFTRDLNFVYLENKSMWEVEDSWSGFGWIDADNRDWSVLSYVRYDSKGNADVVIVNLTPVGRYGYICGVPYDGVYEELINSDDFKYGGTGMVNSEAVPARYDGCHNMPYSIQLDIGPYGAVVLKNIRKKSKNNKK